MLEIQPLTNELRAELDTLRAELVALAERRGLRFDGTDQDIEVLRALVDDGEARARSIVAAELIAPRLGLVWAMHTDVIGDEEPCLAQRDTGKTVDEALALAFIDGGATTIDEVAERIGWELDPRKRPPPATQAPTPDDLARRAALEEVASAWVAEKLGSGLTGTSADLALVQRALVAWKGDYDSRDYEKVIDLLVATVGRLAAERLGLEWRVKEDEDDPDVRVFALRNPATGRVIFPRVLVGAVPDSGYDKTLETVIAEAREEL